MAAQHQHYVPKLLLRGFLKRGRSKSATEQVHVLDLDCGRDFVTSIDNIMAERRYNEFWVDEEHLATIEPLAGRIESHVAPLIGRIRTEKRLAKTEEELGDLCIFMAFQFIRIKKMRLLPEQLTAQLREHVAKLGFEPSQVEELVDWDEDTLKQQHTRHQVERLSEYAQRFADKEFFLMLAPPGSGFYLGDHPVVLHSDEKREGLMQGLGIGVPYIQIYLPISSDVLLCAYCPAVLGQLMKGEDKAMRETQGLLLRSLLDGKVDAAGMRHQIEVAKSMDTTTPLIEKISTGEPVSVGREQVQCYNSLQAFQAHRFVVDPDGCFTVAREIMADRAK